jgi:membrane-bound ClpP family serine protease
MQQQTTLARIACIASLCIGVLSAIFSFAAKSAAAITVFGGLALGIGIISLIMGRKNIDDMQMATAGIIMAIVACLMGIWHMYN